jgi:AcrR family transcriptional regulator
VSPTATPRSPGRPRSAEADAAIIRATLELLVEEGFQGLSVDAVRARAGVGKATIYRRFPDKAALVRAAMEHLHAQIQPPDTGTLRGDLAGVWHAAYAAQPTAEQRLMLPRLLVDALKDEELFAVFRATLVESRRDAMRAILVRGIERGELRPDVDPELLIDLLAGPMIYRFLIDRGDVPDPVGRALEVYDAVLEGVSPARPSRGRPRD